jgi:hypothetical protein
MPGEGHRDLQGAYYAVVVFHESPAGEEYALRIEAGFPARWDEEARRELGLNRGDGYR